MGYLGHIVWVVNRVATFVSNKATEYPPRRSSRKRQRPTAHRRGKIGHMIMRTCQSDSLSTNTMACKPLQ